MLAVSHYTRKHVFCQKRALGIGPVSETGPIWPRQTLAPGDTSLGAEEGKEEAKEAPAVEEQAKESAEAKKKKCDHDHTAEKEKKEAK